MTVTPAGLGESLAEVVALYRAGRLGEALALARRVLAEAGPDGDLLHLAGALALRLGDAREAAGMLAGAVTADPGNVEAGIDLGNALSALGRAQEAADVFRAAIEREPANARAHNGLGAALEARGRLDEAADAFAAAAHLAPDLAEAHANLANVLAARERPREALAAAARALALQPGYAKAHNATGNALAALGRVDDARLAFERALAADPALVEGFSNLGNVLKLQGRMDEAREAYARAVALGPSHAGARFNLGNLLHALGDFEGARREMAESVHLSPTPAARVRLALLAPPIPDSTAGIEAVRATVPAALDALEKDGLRLGDPHQEAPFTPFPFAYHDHDDRPLNERIARFYRRAAPMLTGPAPEPSRTRSSRIRLGVASAFLRGHSVGRLTRGLIENLDRGRFELTVFHASALRDEVSAAIDAAADAVVALPPRNLAAAAEAIAGRGLDVLYYPDIGMSALTYFLAFRRLAPVQAVGWGHPATTGIDTIDYFLSSRLLEGEDADGLYSETLVRLSLLPTCYARPKPPPALERAALGLPEGVPLYLCPQTLFKFHPDFDAVLGALLDRDRDGRLVLIGDAVAGHWRRRLEARFRRAFPAAAGRVLFLDRLDGPRFLALLALADAVLDIPQFSGGNTTMEALSVGAPVVTWPRRLMKGRVSAGCYRQMGVDALIAADADSYVALAFRLAHDRDWRTGVTDAIRLRAPALFGRIEVVRETEDFFAAAHAAAAGGRVRGRDASPGGNG